MGREGGHTATDLRLSEAAGLDLAAGDTRPLVWPRRGESLTPSLSGSLGFTHATASTWRQGEPLLTETESN